ncbi:MAG: DUF2807 domain-containing protein [Bacteroidales bacterium]|nr:DUF2807 domain-containing protein [Bacteroidales bacterium]MBR4327206.1 DUF2807 domain-containing protein [Bacteroidales bacterium]
MKKLLLIIAVVIFAAEAFAQKVEEKNTEERVVGTFNRINVSSIADVTIVTGRPQKVVVSGDAELLAKLETKVVDGELLVRFQSNKRKVVIKESCCDFKVEIYVEDLTSLITSGVVKTLFPEKTVLKKLKVNCSGLTEMIFKDLDVSERLSIDISGAGSADINGAISNLEIDASGACNVSFSGEARVMDLEVSGASSVNLSGHVGELSARASGVSNITSKNFNADAKNVNFSGMARINITD